MDKQQDPAATPSEQDQPQVPEQAAEQAPEPAPAAASTPDGSAAAEPRVEELNRLLEDARSKADQHWDQVMRLRAELDNLNKRQARELENAHKFALERFVSELLGVWDSLELGHNAALEENVSVDKLREGTELTLKLLRDVMAKFGVEQLDPAGEPFNPDFHQAMSLQPRADLPPNTVTAVIQKGYTLNGRLVRPAMVMVSQAASGGVDEQA